MSGQPIPADTVSEVLRAGRELVAGVLAMPDQGAPPGSLRRAAIDLRVMLDELEEVADVVARNDE